MSTNSSDKTPARAYLNQDPLRLMVHLKVEDSNLPSIGLAESLGLTRCLHIEHYLTL